MNEEGVLHMDNQNVIVPTKEEVKKILEYGINDQIYKLENVGEFLGMKLVDSLLPKLKCEPEWGFEGLKIFFENNSIDASCTLEDALSKLD